MDKSIKQYQEDIEAGVDVSGKTEQIREEFIKKFDAWRIHHDSVPCMKDSFVIDEIADWWLEKITKVREDERKRITEEQEK